MKIKNILLACLLMTMPAQSRTNTALLPLVAGGAITGISALPLYISSRNQKLSKKTRARLRLLSKITGLSSATLLLAALIINTQSSNNELPDQDQLTPVRSESRKPSIIQSPTTSPVVSPSPETSPTTAPHASRDQDAKYIQEISKLADKEPRDAIWALKLIALKEETLAHQCIQKISQLADKEPRDAIWALKLIALKRETLAPQCLKTIIELLDKEEPPTAIDDLLSIALKRETLAPQCLKEISQIANQAPKFKVFAYYASACIKKKYPSLSEDE